MGGCHRYGDPVLSRLFRTGRYAAVAMIFGGAMIIGPTKGSSSEITASVAGTEVERVETSASEPHVLKVPQATPTLKDPGPVASERFSRVVASNVVDVELPAASTDEARSPEKSAAAENVDRASEAIASEETGSVEAGTADVEKPDTEPIADHVDDEARSDAPSATTDDADSKPVPSSTSELLVADGLLCGSSASEAISRLLDGSGIPMPGVNVVEATLGGARAEYLPGSFEVSMLECLTPGEIAHEVGHFVVDVIAGSWDGHRQLVREFCLGFDAESGQCAGGWLYPSGLAAEARIDAPGVEHAAHCVGWVLFGQSEFTHCPDAGLRGAAADLVAVAGS